MPKSRVHGFPVVTEDLDVTRAKVKSGGSYYDLLDLLNGDLGVDVTLTSLGVTEYMQTLLDDTTAAAARTTLGISGTNTGDQSLFQTIAVSGQDSVVADTTTDTLTLAASTNIVITTNATTDTVTVATDADVLLADTADVLTAGFATTPYNAGTQTTGTFTPNEVNGNMQYAVNGGAHTLAPPTNNGTIIIQYTNNGSAGAITTSGFTKVSGDAPGTTSGDDFLANITKINGFSHLTWVALQ
jgi:hypothetical protein